MLLTIVVVVECVVFIQVMASNEAAAAKKMEQSRSKVVDVNALQK